VEAWFASAATTSVQPHFVRFRVELLELARRKLLGLPVDSATFARRWGKCQTAVLRAAPLENPDAVDREVARLAAEYRDVSAVEAELEQLAGRHAGACTRREETLAASCRAAAARGHDPRRLEELAAILRFAVDEEEERHVLQMRASTLFRLEAERRGIDVGECSTSSIGIVLQLPTQPRAVAA
jgi:hypothetical protein